jgi:endonuclease/exonuclease/phosphatase family metal-dependent hydrolase
VIQAVAPDVALTVEVENRPTLQRFNEQVLGAQFNMAYPHFMVIDGNDDRGIDVGILSRFPIEAIRSHVADETADGERIFSRDCPEYDVILPGDRRIVVLPNHFKSKRNGNDQHSQDRRRSQAVRAHAIARAAVGRSTYVLVGGDLNDTPDGGTLDALFSDGFRDVQHHSSYPTDRPGTFGTGLPNQKLDYLILSPSLWGQLKQVGIERRGSYHPGTWEPFDTVTGEKDQASDHHLVWAQLDL